jgi:DNA (cytosine-5)-methyltransferase 1
MEQIRIVKEMREAERERGRTGDRIRPRYLCWENVPGAFSSGTPKYEDFRIVLEEILRIWRPSIVVPGSHPGSWPEAGELRTGKVASLAWRCLDAQFWGVAQRRKRIYLLVDFAGPDASKILFDALKDTTKSNENEEKSSCIITT